MRRAALLLALLAAALVQGCGKEPVRTVVHPPRNTPAEEVPAAGQPPAARPPVAQLPLPPADTRPLPSVRNIGDPEGAQLLAQRSLQVPVAGIAPSSLMDMYEQDRGSRKHEAIDILAPTGTPVVAVDDGKIVKLFNSKPGGLTVYHYDAEGKLAYYYAHLARYADGLREGMTVKRGEVIGYVGSTGNADPKTPHLHFAVFKLGKDPKWWQGDPVNPYPAFSRAAPAAVVNAGR